MNVVLIGYRGTGKSRVAEELAKRLDLEVVSTDLRVTHRAGKEIPEIVADHGWEAFRDLESEVLAALEERGGLVIDTGGGIILREANVEGLRRLGPVVLLTAPVAVIRERIAGSQERPSLTRGKSFLDEIEEVLAQREPLYRGCADHIVATAGKNPAEIADEISTIISRHPVGGKK